MKAMKTMKQIKLWMISVILTSGFGLVSCTNDDDPVAPTPVDEVETSYNEATQAWEIAPGKYTIGFGASVEDIRATASYSLSKQKLVKCHDVMKPSMQL